MVKYRLDCYTDIKYHGELPALVLWFDTEVEALKEGADFVDYYSGYSACAWFGVTKEEETEFFLEVLESACAKIPLRGKRE